jgi:hypothetical protein
MRCVTPRPSRSFTKTHVALLPEQAPPQSVKPEPDDGVAVSATRDPRSARKVHRETQEEVEPLTFPPPVTETTNGTAGVGGRLPVPVAADLNLAETDRLSRSETVQEELLIDSQAPPQPAKEKVGAGRASNLTIEPYG